MRQFLVSTSLLVILGFSQAEDLAHTEDPLLALAASVPGVPGEDYPILSSPPDTSFVCDGYVSGYYADTEARCQAFHVCADGGRVGQIKYTFLCPNGTLFNQNYFTCDWWFNVDCSQAVDLYNINFELEAARRAEKIDLQGGGGETSESQPGSYSSSGEFRTGPIDYSL